MYDHGTSCMHLSNPRASTTSVSVAVMTQSRGEGTGTSDNCSTICGTVSTARCKMMSWEVILGTWHHSVDVPEHFHQLAHHQRHRNVKRRHPGRVVGKLLHGVPLYPLLRRGSALLCCCGCCGLLRLWWLWWLWWLLLNG